MPALGVARAGQRDHCSGREVYEGSGGCAGCHGAEGGGGVGPALIGGEVVDTFNNWEDHVIWVINGSPAEPGTIYGDAGDVSLGAANGMPAFGDDLSAREILAVTYFERVELGGVAESDLHDLEELSRRSVGIAVQPGRPSPHLRAWMAAPGSEQMTPRRDLLVVAGSCGSSHRLLRLPTRPRCGVVGARTPPDKTAVTAHPAAVHS